MVIVKGFQLLNIHKNHRHIQILHCGKHIVGCRVGKELHKYQINVRRAEQISGCLRLLLCGYHSAVDNLHRIGERLFERLVLRLKFRHQRRELRQICA